MTEQDQEGFLERLKAIQGRLEDMAAHLDTRGDVAAAVKEKLAAFHAHFEKLKQAGAADHQGAETLESGLESWIGDIDKEYGSPPKRSKNVSM